MKNSRTYTTVISKTMPQPLKELHVYCNKSGMKLGSFKVPDIGDNVKRTLIAINTAGQLRINGRQTNAMPVFASMT